MTLFFTYFINPMQRLWQVLIWRAVTSLEMKTFQDLISNMFNWFNLNYRFIWRSFLLYFGLIYVYLTNMLYLCHAASWSYFAWKYLQYLYFGRVMNVSSVSSWMKCFMLLQCVVWEDSQTFWVWIAALCSGIVYSFFFGFLKPMDEVIVMEWTWV